MKIFLFRIGNKYGPEYETYLNKKLKHYDVEWIHQPLSSAVALQWNKMFLMVYNSNDPIVVMDIDTILLNDYTQLFDYPIQPGEFLGIPAWWSKKTNYQLNGGFYKYYPKECKFIFDKFIADPKKWQRHYIENGTTIGPVNGEQFFVEDTLKERLNLKLIPKSWVTRWTQNSTKNEYISQKYPGTLIKDGNFNEDIKLIHFTTSLNKPHDSEMFKHLYI